MILPEQAADIFVEAADTLVDDFDLVDFLHHLAERIASVIGGTASVGVSLVDRDESLHYMAASPGSAKHLELYQLQQSEGPCLDCFHRREAVIQEGLGQLVHAWPHFVPVAAAAGVDAVYAFPMRLRNRVIGTINVFGEGAGLLSTVDAKMVQAMADVATIAILQQRSIASAEMLAEQLQEALDSRVVIEQAKGALSRQHGVSVDDAFRLLRSHARSNRMHLIDLSRDVVEGTAHIPRAR